MKAHDADFNWVVEQIHTGVNSDKPMAKEKQREYESKAVTYSYSSEVAAAASSTTRAAVAEPAPTAVIAAGVRHAWARRDVVVYGIQWT